MVLIASVLVALNATLRSMNRVSWRTAAPAALEDKPPIRSQAHKNANDAYFAASTDFHDQQLGMEPAQRTAANAVLKSLKDRLSILEKNDRDNQAEYAESEKSYSDYVALCKAVESDLGILGPTGSHKHHLFGGDKHSIGPDEETQVQLNEIFTMLGALKGLYKISDHEAFSMLSAIQQPPRPFNMESGIDFHKYGTSLYSLYRELEAAIPSAAAGQTQDTPPFSIKFLCGLMKDSINIGPHGIAVHLKLKDLTAPAETLPAFSKWLNAAYTIVDEEAKNSSEDKPKPKLAGTVSQAAGGGSRSATSRSIPSCSELDKLYKGYVIPGSDTVAKICPYPHHAFNGGHGGHECYSAAKIVNSKENPFVRTHMSEAVYASLCAVVPKNA
jgi:hypothetical protein